MANNNVFKRYELKYIITKKQSKQLKKLIEDYMDKESFANSVIGNIYYDTPDRLLIRRSLEKPLYKEKLRVRHYGEFKGDGTVYLEIKKKYKGVVYKRRISMGEDICCDYVLGKRDIDDNGQIKREIDYFLKLYKNLEPSVYISYNRDAYFGKSDKNLRMTFDENILVRDYDLSLEKGIYGETILEKDKVLLEVKTSLGIPKWLLEFFSKNNIYKTSFSKYGRAYSEIYLPKNIGGIDNVA